MNKAVNPGAEEVCNNIDDNCNGDERVRPTCGEGWCRRESPGCDEQYCMSGAPIKEKCNFLDDDCDGLTDEDPDMCPTGQTCAAGQCVDSSLVTLDPSGVAGSASGTMSGSNNSGASSATGGSGLTGAKDSAGCALGAGAAHGTLLVLSLLASMGLLRRRRQRHLLEVTHPKRSSFRDRQRSG